MGVNKKIFFRLLLAITLGLGTSSAVFASHSLMEITSMEEAALHLSPSSIGKKRWVIYDLDNTLWEPDHPDQLGSEQWFYGHIKYIKEKQSCPKGDLFRYLLINDHLVAHEAIDMKAVEPCTPGHIAKARQQGARVFAITTRSFPFMHATVRQQKKLKVEFDHFDPERIARINFPHTTQIVAYAQGVFYVSDAATKGEVLEALLRDSSPEELPEEVVYFDDKFAHVDSVGAAITRFNSDASPAQPIVFCGFHYRRLDKQVASFVYDPLRHDRAQVEALHFLRCAYDFKDPNIR